MVVSLAAHSLQKVLDVRMGVVSHIASLVSEHLLLRWGACFQNVSAFGVDIPAKLDLYDSKSQSKDTMWVNGPNRQFEKAIRKLQSNQERHYDVVYLMEGDSVPVKPYWLDAIYNEIKSNKPFAILGRLVSLYESFVSKRISLTMPVLHTLLSFLVYTPF